MKKQLIMNISYKNIIRRSSFKLSLMALALGGVGGGMLSSCSDFLEVEPRNEITLEKFWNEKADVEATVAGLYSNMQSYDIISRMMIWGEFRSENIAMYGTTIQDDINLEYLLKENITASNWYTSWSAFYKVINDCNTVIKYAPQVAAVDPAYSDSELKAHIAEATALRSICYFYLIRTFRDVPYTTEAYLDDNQQMDVKATPFDEVLAQLIESLEAVKNDAVKTYPSSNSTNRLYQTGRITKLAVNAILADMYLWKHDYDKCIACADYVINEKMEELKKSSSYQASDYADVNGFPLIPSKFKGSSNSFGNAFNQIFVEGNSSEGIFELTFMKGSEGNMISNGPFNNFYGGGTRVPFVKGSDYVANDISSASPVVFKNKYDGRAYENFRYKGDMADGINKGVVRFNSGVVLLNPQLNTFYKQSSWGTIYETVGAKEDSRNKSNYILYRLSDVMLMKAEALAMKMNAASGELSTEDEALREQAFHLVNAVNKRSLYQLVLKDTLVYSDYATKGDLTNLIYDERNRELMFEGKRYFDLVRRARLEGNTDYLRGKCKLKSSDNASVVESKLLRMDAIYWPYNLEEIKVNKNLVQNPAFGSGENGSFDKTK